MGSLTASNCVVSENSGDGIYIDHAILSVSDCVITANSYSGIYNYNSHGPSSSVEHGKDRRDAKKIDGPSPGDLTIANTIISDNSEHGIYNDGGYVTILNSRLTGNSAGQGYGGGGIQHWFIQNPRGRHSHQQHYQRQLSIRRRWRYRHFLWGRDSRKQYYQRQLSRRCGRRHQQLYGGVQATNSTISGNSAGKIGGGIASSGGVHLTNSTISGNSAGSAGGIYYVQGQYPYTNEISNTIFNAGALGENIVNNGATVTSHGYNLSSDDGGGLLIGPGDQINTDPLLGPLRDHGGPTLTHMPMRGSPAIDAGDPSFTPTPDHDQRGACFLRVFGPRIDVGSVETQPRPQCVTPAPRPTPH